MAVQVLDRYYLGITALISLALQSVAFVISYVFQFDLITDFSGASNFFIIALITLCFGLTNPPNPPLESYTPARSIIVSLAVMLWAVRLGGFLLFRVIKSGGKDNRFDDIRHSIPKFGGFWLSQAVWAFTVSLPVTILNSPGISSNANPSNPSFPSPQPPFGNNASDIIGLLLYLAGLALESASDVQKYNFKANKPPKDQPNDKGVWGWSRHPNYFGEMIIHFGIWLMAIRPAIEETVTSGPRTALYASLISPLFITLLLLFASGMPTAEKPSQKRAFMKSALNPDDPEQRDAWPKYKRYVKRTSVLVPLPPPVYERFPRWARWLVGDWPMYQFDEGKEGKQAVQEAREQEENRQA